MPSKKKSLPITAAIDSREQTPLDLAAHGLAVERVTLQHGDYSLLVPRLVSHVAIERKTAPDFLACCGRERERFFRELRALRGYTWRFIVIEGRLDDFAAGNYRNKIAPSAVLGTVAAMLNMGIPFIFAGSHDTASVIVAKLLLQKAQQVLDFAEIAAAVQALVEV